MNKELLEFVEGLPNNSELFANLDLEASIAQINELASSEEGKETLEQLTEKYKNKMELFKKGGKLNYLLCLKRGGSIQDCGCGKKIAKAQPGAKMVAPGFDERLETRTRQMWENGELENGGIISAKGGSDGLRERGSVEAYDVRYPEFSTSDTTGTKSTTKDGYPAFVKNVFSGNTLEQNVVTYDENGTPRRSIREITNYDYPEKSDTLYIDPKGVSAGRNPGIITKLFGNVHSTAFMDNIDAALHGLEPRQLSEKEVKRTKKKK